MGYFCIVITCFGLVWSAQAGEAFRIFAPSSSTQTLWIVDAKPNGDGLKLSVAQKVDLGFPARVITDHGKKPLLYLIAVRGQQGKTPGAVVTLSDDGAYEKHHRVNLNDGACYLSLDRNHSFLLGVSYKNGRLNVYPLDKNGIPQKAVSTIDEGRKAAHCVLLSPDNQNIYIPYVKDSLALFQYSFDANSGKVTPLDPRNANPPEGTGPRHMAYHPKYPTVYFSNEQGVGLSVYERGQDGQLTFRQEIDVLPEGMGTDGLSASDLTITADGKFLFAGLRGHERDFDRITRYRVKENGDVELLGLTEADKIPWGLTVSPDGKFLLVSATSGATLTAYRISGVGDLKKVASLAWDQAISDLIAR